MIREQCRSYIAIEHDSGLSLDFTIDSVILRASAVKCSGTLASISLDSSSSENSSTFLIPRPVFVARLTMGIEIETSIKPFRWTFLPSPAEACPSTRGVGNRPRP
jgi:hypothetical protein